MRNRRANSSAVIHSGGVDLGAAGEAAGCVPLGASCDGASIAQDVVGAAEVSEVCEGPVTDNGLVAGVSARVRSVRRGGGGETLGAGG